MAFSNDARSNPFANERTPLNATGNSMRTTSNTRTNNNSVRNSFDRLRQFSFTSSSLPINFQGRSSEDEDENSLSDVDIDELRLDMAHVGSFASGSGLEPGRPTYVRGASPRPSRPTKNTTTTISQQPVDTEVNEEHITDEPDEALAEDVDGKDPRFMNITPGRFWIIFSVIMLAYFVACFDSTLMASSHPVITSYFGASQAASWLSTVFLITSTAFQPLFGRLSDMIGRKSVFLLSLVIFLLTTLWCALAPTIESFIAARAVCGLGAGGTMSLSLIMISDFVRIEYRGVFQSHINVAFGAGSAAGAAFGGYLCDRLGWRWAFGVQVPLIAVCVLLAIFAAPSNLGPMLIKQGEGSAMKAIKNFDFIGSILLVTTVTFLILALNLGGNFLPWSHPLIIGCIVAFFVTAVLFAVAELKAKQALMPLHLLTKMPIASLVFANFLGGIATNTVLFNVPLFFQAVLLTSAASSGFRLAVPSLIGSMAGISTGYIITYTRKLKPTLALGGVVYLIGSTLVLFLNRDTSEFMSLVLITGVPLGQGFVFPNTMMSALAVSEQSAQAVVTTTIGLWRNLGTVMGVAVSSLVFQNALVANLDRMVTGPNHDKIISAVRSSVGAIRHLEPQSQTEVTTAYAVSLRTAFYCALIASVLINILIFPVRLPRLRSNVKLTIPAGE